MSRSTIGRYLAHSCINYLRKYVEQQKPGAQASSDNQEQADLEASQAFSLPIKVIEDKWHSQEQGHREKEKIYWHRSLYYANYTVIAVWLSTVFSFLAFGGVVIQAIIADRTRVANDRPWIGNDVAIEVVSWNERSLNIKIKVPAFNSGHSPAEDVIPIINEFAFLSGDDAAKKFTKECDGAHVPTARAVFPNQSGNYTFITTLDPQTTSVFSFESQKDIPNSTFLFIGGCIVYRFSDGSTKLHHSRFLYYAVDKDTYGELSFSNWMRNKSLSGYDPSKFKFVVPFFGDGLAVD